MSKVTAKYHVSIPKGLTERLDIRAGDELEWEDAAGTLRARLASRPKARLTLAERLRSSTPVAPGRPSANARVAALETCALTIELPDWADGERSA